MLDRDSKELAQDRRRDDARDRLDRVWPVVFGELKRVAHRRLGAEREGHTLCTTALVHEVYLRLADQRFVAWDDRGEFFAQAGRAMRRILVDYARRHRALRRGGGVVPISLNVDDSITSETRSAPQIAVAERADEIIALDEALARFAELEPRAASVVECRFFAGLTEDETAVALCVTPRTVARDWVKARAWLYRELNDSAADAS
jgi:RNA polymerase sigma factor (TIGR02999 family)